jgi:hypothetical protein
LFETACIVTVTVVFSAPAGIVTDEPSFMVTTPPAGPMAAEPLV